MKITYILGNGFDVNIGLRTEYQNFYDYYIEEPSTKTQVKLLKRAIRRNRYKMWSDLEVGLGKISANYKTVDDFMVALQNVSDCLRQYIAKVNGDISIDEYNCARLQQDLCTPHDYLVEADKRSCISFYEGIHEPNWYVNIVTFNYTDIIDRLIPNIKGQGLSRFGKNKFGYGVFLNNIEHIHGAVEGTILVGVDNIEQIANIEFRDDVRLRDMFVKPISNIAVGGFADGRCCEYLDTSDLICIFGHSMGSTDKTWWDKIKENLTKRDCRLILFVYDKDIKNSQMYLRPTLKRKWMERLGWNEDIADKIYIGLNTDIFNLKKDNLRERV